MTVIDDATMLENKQLTALNLSHLELMKAEESFGGDTLTLFSYMRLCLVVGPGLLREQ